MKRKPRKDFSSFTAETPLRKAVAALYLQDATIGLVCDRGGKLLGVVTRSDIKQALLKGFDPSTPVRAIMNAEFVAASAGTSRARLRALARTPSKYGTGSINQVPVLDSRGRVVDMYINTPEQAETVLVTGGAGYIGSLVCRKLLAQGYRVIVIDALLFGDAGIRELRDHPRFTLLTGDITDMTLLIAAVKEADRVVHLAGIVGDPASSLDPLQTMEANHFATKLLIDICKYYGISRFVFASSCSVYGAADAVLDENSPLNPVSLYAQSKLYSERELLAAAGDDFHPVILRFGTVYGLSPRMRFDLVANIMTAHALSSGRITVDGGAQWRPLVHVDDVAEAVVAALTAPAEKVVGRVFNVGSSRENYRIADIAVAVAEVVPDTKIIELDTVRDRRDYQVSCVAIERATGWRTDYTLSEGIVEIADAFKKGAFPRWRHARYNNYLSEKLRSEDRNRV